MLHSVKRFITPVNKEQLFKEIFFQTDNYQFLAGGITLNWRGNHTPLIINLKNIIFSDLIETDFFIKIGAGITISSCAEKLKALNIPVFEALISALNSIASPQIRNAATLGGNFISNFDFSDSLGFLYLLQPDLEIITSSGDKIFSFSELYNSKTKKIQLPKASILNSFIFNKEKITGYSQSKYIKETRVGRDIATIHLTSVRKKDSGLYDIAIGAYWLQLECFFDIADCDILMKKISELPFPKSDQRASGDYRKKILPYLITKCLN